MNINENYEEYLKNYFKNRPALLYCGELFVKYAYDPSIKRFIDAYDGKGNPKFVQAIEEYTATFSDQQKEMLKELTKSIVFDSMAAMLDLFVLWPELGITVTENGEKVDILSISDNFSEDMLGEDGCIDMFSKYLETR